MPRTARSLLGLCVLGGLGCAPLRLTGVPGRDESPLTEAAAAFCDQAAADGHHVEQMSPEFGAYLDEERTRNVDLLDVVPDDSKKGGVDTVQLFFLNTHGSEGFWSVGGRSVSPAWVRYGNRRMTRWRGGRMRHLWLCSCQTLAHGMPCTSDGCVGYSPWDFQPKFSLNENLLVKWSGALGSGVRMVCGAATNIACNEGEVGEMWANLRAGFGPADSFILGNMDKRWRAPLCFSRGRPDPLYESELRSGRWGHNDDDAPFFLQYPIVSPGGFMEPSDASLLAALSLLAPVGSPEVPPPAPSDREAPEGKRLSLDDLPTCRALPPGLSCGTTACYTPDRKPGILGHPDELADDEFVEAAKEFMRTKGWTGCGDLSAPRVIRLHLDRYGPECAATPEENKCPSQQGIKGVVVVFKRQVRLQPESAHTGIEGDATIIVSLDPSKEVVAARREWPSLLPVRLPPGAAVAGERKVILDHEEAREAARVQYRDVVKREAPPLPQEATWLLRRKGGYFHPTYVYDFETGTGEARGLIRIEIPAY